MTSQRAHTPRTPSASTPAIQQAHLEEMKLKITVNYISVLVSCAVAECTEVTIVLNLEKWTLRGY